MTTIQPVNGIADHICGLSGISFQCPACEALRVHVVPYVKPPAPSVTLHTFNERELDLIDRALQIAYGQLELSRDVLRVYRGVVDGQAIKSVVDRDHQDMGDLLLKIQAAR